MSIEEFGTKFRYTAPEPEAGYWDNIDSMIAKKESEKNVDTDSELVCLTNMEQNIFEMKNQSRRLFTIAAGIMLVALVGAGVWIVNTGDNVEPSFASELEKDSEDNITDEDAVSESKDDDKSETEKDRKTDSVNADDSDGSKRATEKGVSKDTEDSEVLAGLNAEKIENDLKTEYGFKSVSIFEKSNMFLKPVVPDAMRSFGFDPIDPYIDNNSGKFYYSRVSEGGKGKIIVANNFDGEVLWETEADYDKVLYADDNFVVVSIGGGFDYYLDQLTGEVSFGLENIFGWEVAPAVLSVDGKTAYGIVENGIFAWDLYTNKVLWESKLAATPIIATADVIILNGIEKDIYVVDAGNGNLLKTYETDEFIKVISAP